jgi:hypothetical protein
VEKLLPWVDWSIGELRDRLVAQAEREVPSRPPPQWVLVREVELFHGGKWWGCFWWVKDYHYHSQYHRHCHPHSHSSSPHSHSHCHPHPHSHSHSHRHCHSYYFHLRPCSCNPHCCFPVWSQLSIFWRWVSCLGLPLWNLDVSTILFTKIPMCRDLGPLWNLNVSTIFLEKPNPLKYGTSLESGRVNIFWTVPFFNPVRHLEFTFSRKHD